MVWRVNQCLGFEWNLDWAWLEMFLSNRRYWWPQGSEIEEVGFDKMGSK